MDLPVGIPTLQLTDRWVVRRFAFAYASLDYGRRRLHRPAHRRTLHDRAEIRALPGIEQGPHL